MKHSFFKLVEVPWMKCGGKDTIISRQILNCDSMHALTLILEVYVSHAHLSDN